MNKEAEIQKILSSYLPEEKVLAATEQIMDIVYTTYTYTLDDLDVSTLNKFWKQVVDSGYYKIDVRDIPFLAQAERLRMTQLRFFGLIAKVRVNNIQQPNMWLLTNKGADFIGGKDILDKVYARNNKIKPHPKAKLVNIRDFRHVVDFGPSYEIEKHPNIIKQLAFI